MRDKEKQIKGGTMDAKSIGNTIARLRKKSGMTQLALANRLDVSDKAVSKWESGQGYPDISVFPRLASLFGVSIDYLMLGEKKGIVIAGNIIADIVKSIDLYPQVGMLAYVSDITLAVGGCAPNTAINLVKIDRSIPVSVIGKVGTDDNGRFIVSQLQRNGIDVEGITYSSEAPTSFTDVMSMPSGERTFFNKKGANSEFAPEDIAIQDLNCNMLHIGYILLLDVFDAEDEEYGTVMARFLHDVQKRGIKTSIDVVSDSSADYGKKIIPALKYCNYALMNELEGCRIWNLDPRKADGRLHKENIRLAMERMAACGVADKVVIHSKEASFVLDVKTGEFTEVASLKIPAEEIKGSVGAGDAFCAGCLYGIYNEFTDRQMLEFASAAAACNLFAANSVDGMRNKNEIMMLEEKYGRLTDV